METVFPKQTVTKYYTSPLGRQISVFLHWQTTFLLGMDYYYYRYYLCKTIAPSTGDSAPTINTLVTNTSQNSETTPSTTYTGQSKTMNTNIIITTIRIFPGTDLLHDYPVDEAML